MRPRLSDAYSDERLLKQEKSARDAFKKDIGGLMGFVPGATATLWNNPPVSVNAYWFDQVLRQPESNLGSARHLFSVIYVQLGGGLNTALWSEEAIRNAATSWWRWRECSPKHGENEIAAFDFGREQLGRHEVVVASWEGARLP